jgi:hypothetical protein
MSITRRRLHGVVAKSVAIAVAASFHVIVSAPPSSGAETSNPTYEYTVMAKTPLDVNLGMKTVSLNRFGQQPSTSDFGEVAFVGHHDGGEGLFAKAGTDPVRSINPQFSQNSSRTFGDIALVTNRHKIIARDRVSGSPASFRIRVWEADPGFDGTPAPPNGETVIAYGGTGFGGIKPDFDGVVNPTMSSNGHVAFVGVNGATPDSPPANYLAWGTSRPFKRSEPLEGPLHPVINDQGAVLVKVGSKSSDPSACTPLSWRATRTSRARPGAATRASRVSARRRGCPRTAS